MVDGMKSLWSLLEEISDRVRWECRFVHLMIGACFHSIATSHMGRICVAEGGRTGVVKEVYVYGSHTNQQMAPYSNSYSFEAMAIFFVLVISWIGYVIDICSTLSSLHALALILQDERTAYGFTASIKERRAEQT